MNPFAHLRRKPRPEACNDWVYAEPPQVLDFVIFGISAVVVVGSFLLLWTGGI